MMYSQQEYDMVRRQTMQIEAEKRALLRWALIAVTLLFAGSLFLTAWMYNRYSSSASDIQDANDRAKIAQDELAKVSDELKSLRATLEKNNASLATQNEIIQANVPKMMSRKAEESELADLAEAIYQQPGHVISLSGPPPNTVNMKSVRRRGQPNKYTFVAGVLNSKWYLYSVLVKNQEDR